MQKKRTKDSELSEGAVLERAKSLATDWIFAVSLQYDRIINPRPQDQAFDCLVINDFNEADIHFFVIALNRLKKTATTIEQVPQQWSTVQRALDEFDVKVPWLKCLRDVFEHLEDYAIDSERRHIKNISRRSLQVWSATEHGLNWLGYDINFQEAHSAAEDLYEAIKKASESFVLQ